MITPEGVSQSEALSYSADAQARIPFTTVGAPADGEDGTAGEGGDDSTGEENGGEDGTKGEQTTPPSTSTTTQPPSTSTTTTDSTTTAPSTGDSTTAPSESTTAVDAETTSGDGPGFGVLSGVLGTAGGAAYAAKRLLCDDAVTVDAEAVEEIEDGEDETGEA
jgi:hypothetical protein